jgi:hypothetical protein
LRYIVARHFIPLLRDFICSEITIPGLVTVRIRTIRPDDLKGLLSALVRLANRIERGEVDPSMGVALTR